MIPNHTHERVPIGVDLRYPSQVGGIVDGMTDEYLDHDFQLDRRKDQRPKSNSLKGSRALEADADMVLLIYRDVVINHPVIDFEITQLIVGKNRHHPVSVTSPAFTAYMLQFAKVVERRLPDLRPLGSGRPV